MALDSAVRVARIQNLVNKYSQGFPVPATANGGRHDETHTNEEVVALTGATGNLGCVMLYLLLKRSTILRIYVLNRQDGDQARKQIKGLLQEKELDDSVLDTDRITYLNINFGKKDLGLTKGAYEDVSLFNSDDLCLQIYFQSLFF